MRLVGKTEIIGHLCEIQIGGLHVTLDGVQASQPHVTGHRYAVSGLKFPLKLPVTDRKLPGELLIIGHALHFSDQLHGLMGIIVGVKMGV